MGSVTGTLTVGRGTRNAHEETGTMDERFFKAGTIIRCNRCDAKGEAPRDFRAIKENDRVWRIQDMMIHPTCGHMDAHWVFNCDIE